MGRAIRDAVATRYQGRWGFVAVALLGTLGLLGGPNLVLTQLTSTTAAAPYLSALWVVIGTVLALTVAVLVFALQAHSANRFGGSLRELAEDSWLLPYLYLGTVSLLVDGVVLLGLGAPKPAGWTATWAVLVSGSVLVLLPFLVLRVMDSLYPRRIHERRLRRFDRQVEWAVDRNVLQRIALRQLNDECAAVGIQLSPLRIVPPNHFAVASRTSGTVTDISLDRLEAIGRRVSGPNQPVQQGRSPILFVKIGDQVAAGTPIISIPINAPIGCRFEAELLLRMG
jgi:hypothetical protein